MLHNEERFKLCHPLRIALTVCCGVALLTLISLVAGAQTPTPTPITKTDPPSVQTPSTVGRITKWTGVSKSGIGIIGDSVMTESNGNIGINVANPTDRLAIDGDLSTNGVINTTLQYNIGRIRVLGADASRFNLFAGFGVGASNSTGDSNAFFGNSSGSANTTGSANSFFGFLAGRSNTTGGANSFFGLQAGLSNTTGSGNAFFGGAAGNNNTNGGNNSFFGNGAGYRNASGNSNAFVGSSAGFNNTNGGNNSFFGFNAGQSNTTEQNNTFIGANSNGAVGIANATALGANAVVTQSNSLVLGNNASVGIGTSAPQAKLHVVASTAGRFDGNVTVNGNITVTGAASLTAADAIHATSADTANSLANTASVNGTQINGALTNATIAGSAVTGNIAAGQISGELTNATIPGYVAKAGDTMNGAFITLDGDGYYTGGDIMIASGHAYGANTGGAITLNTNGAYAGNNPSPGYISLQIQGNESLRVASNSNVEVGTPTPQAKLHVSNMGGSAGQFDGNVTVNGNLTVSGSTNISSSVNHDSTLSGNGSTGSPLTVVSTPNGVVTTASYSDPS